MQQLRNDSVIPGRGIVPTVGNGLNVICTNMWLHIIWIWASCGGARCPGAPCVKGMPQDCMDHVRGAHDVPWDIKSASLENYFPPWTVQRQIWMDALKPCHSGVSTDVLLFSDINLSLVHHYRVFKRGLPHLAFRKDYLTCLRVFVSQTTALAQCDMASPVPPSSVSACHVMLAPLSRSLSRLGGQDVPVARCDLLVCVTNLSVSSLRP